MSEDKVIKLPFWETVKRSIMYVFLNMEAFLKISAFWFVVFIAYQLLAGSPATCTFAVEGCTGGGKDILSLLVLALFSIAFGVAFTRFVILREEKPYFSFHFGVRELLYIGKAFVIGLIAGLATFMVVLTLGGIGITLGLTKENPIMMIFVFVTIIVVLTLTLRLYLVLPATAVDNKTFTMRKSWEITEGNSNRIFWGVVLVSLIGIILVVAATLLYQYIMPETYIGKFAFAALAIVINFFDVSIKASFFAHVYQYFMYFDGKKTAKKSKVVESKTAEKASVKAKPEAKSKTVTKKAEPKTVKAPTKATASKSKSATKSVAKSKPKTKATVKPKTTTKKAPAKPKAKAAKK